METEEYDAWREGIIGNMAFGWDDFNLEEFQPGISHLSIWPDWLLPF